jgi:hypothetical protein
MAIPGEGHEDVRSDPNSMRIGRMAGGTVGMDILSGVRRQVVGWQIALTIRTKSGFPSQPVSFET